MAVMFHRVKFGNISYEFPKCCSTVKKKPRHHSDNGAFYFIDVVRSGPAAKLVQHLVGAFGPAQDIFLTTRHFLLNP